MRTFTVKEVRKYTGLTRKQLFSYKNSIEPVGYENNAKYKLYDQEGLEKLSMAALYSELGATPARINKLFQNEIDRKELMIQLIDEARQKIQDLEDIITIAEMYKEVDISVLSSNPLVGMTRHEYAESIRKETNSNDLKVIEEAFEDKKIEKKFEKIIRKISQSIKDAENDVEAQIVEKSIESLISFIIKDIGVENEMRLLSGLAIGMSIQESLVKYIDDVTGQGEAIYIGEAITLYQMNHFIEDVEAKIGDDNKVDDNVIEIIYEFIKKWFGYNTYEEAKGIMSGFIMNAEQEDEPDQEVIEYFSALRDGFEKKIQEEQNNG